MKRITQINLLGFSAVAAACVASGAIAVGCAPPAPARPAPVTTAPGAQPQPPINPTSVVQDVTGLTDLNQFNQAHIDAIVGTYTGSFVGLDQDYNEFDMNYTVTLSRATSPSAPGKTYMQAIFYAKDDNTQTVMTTQGLMQPSYLPTWGGASYVFTSMRLNAPTIYEGGPIVLQLQVSLNALNQVDPTSYSIDPPIRIVDGVFLQDVVMFNNDLQKH